MPPPPRGEKKSFQQELAFLSEAYFMNISPAECGVEVGPGAPWGHSSPVKHGSVPFSPLSIIDSIILILLAFDKVHFRTKAILAFRKYHISVPYFFFKFTAMNSRGN